ncbi:hypothetical protein [Kordia sp.]|uniref:hypothetical protein n=1 Tax=Kordia sp. TaxID=1965332 RepID=UPI003D2AB03C
MPLLILNSYILKKQNLKNLKLNRQPVSNLNLKITGGGTGHGSCGCVTDTCHETFTCRAYGCPPER